MEPNEIWQRCFKRLQSPAVSGKHGNTKGPWQNSIDSLKSEGTQPVDEFPCSEKPRRVGSIHFRQGFHQSFDVTVDLCNVQSLKSGKEVRSKTGKFDNVKGKQSSSFCE